MQGFWIQGTGVMGWISDIRLSRTFVISSSISITKKWSSR